MELELSQATTLFTEVLLTWTPNDMSKVTPDTVFTITVTVDKQQGDTFDRKIENYGTDYVIQNTRLFLPPMRTGTKCQVTISNARLLKCDIVSSSLSAFLRKALFQYLDIRYRGHVEFQVATDGNSLLHYPTTSAPFLLGDAQLEPPVESFLRIYLPSEKTGFIPQLTNVVNGRYGKDEILSYAFGKIAIDDIPAKQYWHFIELTFKGTVKVSAWLDGAMLVGWTQLTSVGTKTQRLFLPPLSLGRNLQLVSDPTATGEIISVSNGADEQTPAFTTYGSLDLSYIGQVAVDFFMDGRKVLNSVFVGTEDDVTVKYSTLYFPAQSGLRYYVNDSLLHGKGQILDAKAKGIAWS